MTDFFITIDFDGTVTNADITDAIIKEFARPGWEEAERLWEAGAIGSRECLTIQMLLIEQPLERLIEHARKFDIDPYFHRFIDILKTNSIPFAVISDGFGSIINGALNNAGLNNIPVYANELFWDGGKLMTAFENSSASCNSGMCKCKTADTLVHGLPVVHIGDGRSDFCLAGKAFHVFAKGKLVDYCREKDIPHSRFTDFSMVIKGVKRLLKQTSRASLMTQYKDLTEKAQPTWNMTD